MEFWTAQKEPGCDLWGLEGGDYREILEKGAELETKLGCDKVWLIDVIKKQFISTKQKRDNKGKCPKWVAERQTAEFKLPTVKDRLS